MRSTDQEPLSPPANVTISGRLASIGGITMLIDFAPDKSIFPFEPRWYDGAGPKVHYVDEGQGRPVVMFHGNPTWSVIQQLRGRFRCIAVDYPGFGLSERPSGHGYTSAEHAQVIGKLDDSIVVGQDWDRPIGMTVALDTKPMELVWAMKDPAFGSQAIIARWQRDFPSANLTRVPEANHYIQEDAPEAIAAAVDRVEARLLKRER